MSDWIFVMNDGEIVQIGTPEEIVTNPSDAYVAEFVKGISRVHLVRAESLMEPLEGRAPTSKQVPPDADLAQIIDHFMEDQSPVTVAISDGTAVGMISIKTALGALRG